MSAAPEPHTVSLIVADPLLVEAEIAVQALGAHIAGRTVPDFADGTTVLHLAMPDAPTGATWVDLVLTQERDPGEAPRRWISAITYLDADHREIAHQDIHVTVPITLDQIPEPLRGAHRH